MNFIKTTVFSDGSDLEGIEKTEDILHMKILRRFIGIVDGWPKGPNKGKYQRIYLVTMEWSFLFLSALYLKNNVGKVSTFDLGHSYITFFMIIIALSRSMIICTKKYNDLGHDFLNVMHLFNHRHKSDKAYEMHVFIHKVCHFFTYYTIGTMIFGILLFNLTPLYTSYAKGMFRTERPANATFDHSVYFVLPFDYSTDYRGYTVLNINNWYISCVCSTYFCTADLFIFFMVFHLYGHIRVLIYNLDSIPRPASLPDSSNEGKNDSFLKYTEDESKAVFSTLRECIHHHSLVIEFTSRMGYSYGEWLLMYYLFHQVSGCLLLLMCSPMDMEALVRYGPLTTIIFQQLILLSVIFELLGSSNDKLIDSMYTTPWEYMHTKHRKLVYVMLKQSQRPINLRLMNMITVGVQTMIAIMKTSFSYFVMLKTVVQEE